MTYYLKYRPQKLSELDLESVRTSLQKILSSKSIPHAFLFSGPKGTGKTSAARILAKIINCQRLRKSGEPCNKCDQCISIIKGHSMDVIEMDAASNRGIDDIRSLRENVVLAPSSAKKKVYIIDEAHMLTTEAANAFLKTLEEPPDHVVFILATTDPKKLPSTVLSRVTRVNFVKAKPVEIKRQIKRRIKGEKLKLEKGVVELIAKAADGSFRDADKILERLSLDGKKITLTKATKHISERATDVVELMEILVERDSKKALLEIEKQVSQGVYIESYIEGLLEKLHRALLAKEGLEEEDLPGFSKEEVISLFELITEARDKTRFSTISQLPLEVAVVKWCSAKWDRPIDDPPKLPKKKHKNPKSQLKDGVWDKVLSSVRAKNTTVEALLRASRPIEFDGENLELGVYYKFHKERLEMVHNKRVLEEVISEVVGCSVCVKFALAEKEKVESDSVLTEEVDQDIIQAAKEIFGS